MIEIVCRGKSTSEGKLKCEVTEMLITENKIPTETVIDLLNAIGGICITEREEM